MPDGVDHHQRALPAVSLVFAPDPPLLQEPVRQLAFQPRNDLLLRVDPFLFGHGASSPLPQAMMLDRVRGMFVYPSMISARSGRGNTAERVGPGRSAGSAER